MDQLGLNTQQYNRSKWWQIALFTLNNTSTNIYLFLIGFVTYYANGVAGLAVMLVSTVLGFIRFFDGAIDPFIGAFIDKTETKFGKYRPLILMGNIITLISILIIFTTHHLPVGARLAFLIFALVIHKIGYSLQASVTKAGQTVLTNDPKQRPLYAVFDGIYNIVIFTGGQMFVSNYLAPKYGGTFTMDFFAEFITWVMSISLVLAVLAVIGIWEKDRKEFFGLGEKTVETKGFREYWEVIKNNRPLQMLSLAASVDKLATQMMRDSVVVVMVFGIMVGNYGMSGTISALAVIPTLLITFYVSWLAGRKGQKKAFTTSLWIALFSFIGLGLVFLMAKGNPASLDMQNFGLLTFLFILLYCLSQGFASMPTTLVVPMTADVSDYETNKSGRYVAGMIGTIFSFIDQLVSSLAPFIIGVVVSILGYADAYPQNGDPFTSEIFIGILLLMSVIPAILMGISLVFMKFYKLDREAMEEIQKGIAEKKAASQ